MTFKQAGEELLNKGRRGGKSNDELMLDTLEAFTYYALRSKVIFQYVYCDREENRLRGRVGSSAGMRAGTLSFRFMKDNQIPKSRVLSDRVTRYYDLFRQAWRSFRNDCFIIVHSVYNPETGKFTDDKDEIDSLKLKNTNYRYKRVEREDTEEERKKQELVAKQEASKREREIANTMNKIQAKKVLIKAYQEDQITQQELAILVDPFDQELEKGLHTGFSKIVGSIAGKVSDWSKRHGAQVGEIRTFSDSNKYQKQNSGKWVRVTAGRKPGQKNKPKEDVEHGGVVYKVKDLETHAKKASPEALQNFISKYSKDASKQAMLDIAKKELNSRSKAKAKSTTPFQENKQEVKPAIKKEAAEPKKKEVASPTKQNKVEEPKQAEQKDHLEGNKKYIDKVLEETPNKIKAIMARIKIDDDLSQNQKNELLDYIETKHAKKGEDMEKALSTVYEHFEKGLIDEDLYLNILKKAYSIEKSKQVYVNAILTNSEGKILFLRRSQNDDFQPGELCLPGGKLDPGETVYEAVVREVREETALDIENPTLIGEIENDNAIMLYFTAEVELNQASLLVLDHEEHGNYEFYDEDELVDINLMLDLGEHLQAVYFNSIDVSLLEKARVNSTYLTIDYEKIRAYQENASKENGGNVSTLDKYSAGQPMFLDADAIFLNDALSKATKNFTTSQKRKVARVMREYKSGRLTSSLGQKVSSRDEAISMAIAAAESLEKSLESDDLEKGELSSLPLKVVTVHGKHGDYQATRRVAQHNLSDLFHGDQAKQEKYHDELRSLKHYRDENGRSTYYSTDKNIKSSGFGKVPVFELHPHEVEYRKKLLGHDEPVSKKEYQMDRARHDNYEGQGASVETTKIKGGKESPTKKHHTSGWPQLYNRTNEVARKHILADTDKAEMHQQKLDQQKDAELFDATIGSIEKKFSEVLPETNTEELIGKIKWAVNRTQGGKYPAIDDDTDVEIQRLGRTSMLKLKDIKAALQTTKTGAQKPLGITSFKVVKFNDNPFAKLEKGGQGSGVYEHQRVGFNQMDVDERLGFLKSKFNDKDKVGNYFTVNSNHDITPKTEKAIGFDVSRYKEAITEVYFVSNKRTYRFDRATKKLTINVPGKKAQRDFEAEDPMPSDTVKLVRLEVDEDKLRQLLEKKDLSKLIKSLEEIANFKLDLEGDISLLDQRSDLDQEESALLATLVKSRDIADKTYDMLRGDLESALPEILEKAILTEEERLLLEKSVKLLEHE